MLILLTNDDGIFASGLAALEKALRAIGNVVVVAPLTEQSGVGHGITFQTPLLVKQVFVNENQWGWAVDGTPADCVKIGITQICSRKPDIVVSGINGGLNAGINVLYSGTVAGAVEGSFYGIDSFAVSLEHAESEPFDQAASVAVSLIESILKCKRDQQKEAIGLCEKIDLGKETGPRNPSTFCDPVCASSEKSRAKFHDKISNPTKLFNINIPIAALNRPAELKVVPMDTNQYWGEYDRRTDPSGKAYYWLIGRPVPKEAGKAADLKSQEQEMTDLIALSKGFITMTPLSFDMTRHEAIPDWAQQNLSVGCKTCSGESSQTNTDDLAASQKTGPGLRTEWVKY